MERGGSHRRKVKRHFTPLDWLRKDRRASDRRIADRRQRFRTAAPDRDEDRA
jgi:hypothetical protein